MPDFEPQHSNLIIDNIIYPDDSGFMFDLPPALGTASPTTWDEGTIYGVPTQPRFRMDGHWMGWSQWAEKWQKDVRFANVSDYNAQANIFPEVHDPWMFSEYVFEGSQVQSGTDAASITVGVVEPILIDPSRRTITEDGPLFEFLNQQMPTYVAYEDKPLYTLESRWQSKATGQTFWESELQAVQWREAYGQEINGEFTRLPIQRRVILQTQPAINAGVKLYRHQVWSHSLRWGYSQNIPERIITMTGPKDFFRPEGVFTSRIVPHITVKSGSPIYDNLSNTPGGQQAAFMAENLPDLNAAWSNSAHVALVDVHPVGVVGQPDTVYTYPVAAEMTVDQGTRVIMPVMDAAQDSRYSMTELNYAAGELVHRGCAFWKGINGQVSCQYWTQQQAGFQSNPNLTKPVTDPLLCPSYQGPTATEARANYKERDGRCPYYTPQGPRVLLAYTGIANTDREIQRMKQITGAKVPSSGMPGLGGSLIDGVMGGGLPNNTWDNLNDTNAGITQTRIEITYSPEIVPVEGKQTYHNTPDGKPNPKEPEASIRVISGTGGFPLDEKANEPFQGVDTPFFGYINQVNYRINRNVTHCYRADECDSIISTRTNVPGWNRGQYSKIDFTGHNLRMPGYPASDGSGSWCHYGDGFCPYNRVDRRAVEYSENYKLMTQEILMPFRGSGIGAFINKGLIEAVIVNGQVVPVTQETYDDEIHGDLLLVAARLEDEYDPPVMGHWHPVVDGYRIYFFYDRPSWSEDHRQARVAAHIIQFNDDNEPCYMNIPSERDSEIALIYGDTESIPWLVELYDDYKPPVGNLISATNAKRFWGGRSPQYKDHSKRGRELRADFGYSLSNRIPSSMASGNQFGGVLFGRSAKKNPATMGYWTDKDGDYIIESPLATLEPALEYNDPQCVKIEDRILNLPPVRNGIPPIDGVPGIFLQSKENPEMNRTSDYAAVGATYANDTQQLLEWFRATAYIEEGKPVSNWQSLLPDDPLDPNGGKVKVAAPSITRWTPVERFQFTCDICGVISTEEEVNYLRDIDAYQAQRGGVCLCPRMDGGEVFEDGPMDHIPCATSQGHVDVWGPPGTTVRHDAFFWKQPTLVGRIFDTQISHKLGRYNPKGGGYTFDNLDPSTEKIGRLPVPIDHGYNPGISHQLTVPWSAPGESLAALRTRVKPWFGLDTAGDRDVARVSRLGIAGEIKVPQSEEVTFILMLNDRVRFEREFANARSQAGLIVEVANGLPEVLMQEVLIQNDRPLPQRINFPNTAEGTMGWRDALRYWLLNGVDDSYLQWSSTPSISANLLANTLQEAGKNPNLGKPFSPGKKPGEGDAGADAGPYELDERIIAAYSKKEAGGLHMVTRNHMQRARNRLLPMLHYDLSTDAYLHKAGGDYTLNAQYDNANRHQQRERDVPYKVFGTIPPQIVAANDNGQESYVEWEDPELVMGKGRAYYPTGPSWWRINQKIGHIKRAGGTNPLHMDASPDVLTQQVYEGYVNQGMNPYTGDNIVSTVTYFLHGRLPLDKEVVKAYVVYQVDDGPSAAALGCMGKYDGFEGPADVGTYKQTGQLVADENSASYRGNSECFYQHFHPWLTAHEGDVGSYANGSVQSTWGSPGYSGFDSRRHWVDGANPDPGTPYVLSEPDFTLLAEGEPITFETWSPWLWRERDENLRTYDPAVTLLGKYARDDSYGFDVVSDSLDQWTWGQDLVQLVTEHELWKELSFDQYTQTRATYSTQVMASLNTIDAIQTFDYFATPFRQSIYARQHQAIPGWFDYSSYDTSGRFGRIIETEIKVKDTSWADGPQVIVQAGSAATSTGAGGGSGPDQAGNVERVLDVTQAIEQQYNQRVTRFFNCKLGLAYIAFYDYFHGKFDTLDYDQPYPPLWWWNYRVWSPGRGIWLTNPWSMMPLASDEPYPISPDGDVIDSSEAIRASRIDGVTNWDTMGLTSEDEDYLKYHPLSLTNATSNEAFASEDTVVGTNPIPVDDANAYWRVSTTEPVSNWFTVDLRQTPYERWRRPWRYEAPEVDATNATCPNANGCWVSARGLTVGELMEQETHNVWGGSPPNRHSTHCYNCNTLLENVIMTGGDGITTVEYDPADEPDLIINALDVATDTTDGWHQDAKHGFVIEYYNSRIRQWRVLVAITHNNQTGMYRYRVTQGNNWIWADRQELPSTLKGVPCDHLDRPIGSVSGEFHFPIVAGRKLRYKVVRPAYIQESEGWMTCGAVINQKQITVAQLNEPIENYVGRQVHLRGAFGQDLASGEVTASQDNSGNTILFTNIDVSNATHCQLTWDRYVARCTRFRAWGYPFKKGEVVITPPAMMETLYLSSRSPTMVLANPPSQITRLSVDCGDDPSVIMTEVDDPRSNFHWSVEKVTTGALTYLRITAGKWYYDHSQNTVTFPFTYVDPDTQAISSIWSLNETLYQAQKPLLIDTRPSAVFVEYLFGLGASVEVDIEAVGKGPSYQLDRECICFVAGNTPDEEPLPPELSSDALPDLGWSVQLKHLSGSRYKMNWRCYNHDLITWQRNLKWVAGDELAAGAYDDNSVMNLWTGNHGFEVSDLGENAVIEGRATGEITLYGAPNTILSGDLAVYAKAYTHRSYSTDQGVVTTHERTGGLRQGAVVFRLSVNETFEQGRKSISARVPKLLVYLKERDLSDPV